MVRHDVSVDDSRQPGSDSFDVSLHGSALPGTFEDYLGFGRRFRTVAGVPRVAVEFRELMLRPAMSGNESSRRRKGYFKKCDNSFERPRMLKTDMSFTLGTQCYAV